MTVHDIVPSRDSLDQIDVVRQKMLDTQLPGSQVAFDPDEAELAGFFIEDAITEKDAEESLFDPVDPVFMGR